MAEGIYAEVVDGFAHIQFLDPALVGTSLTKLLEIGGPGLIDVDTRTGTSKIYIMPESVALDAGLIEAAGTPANTVEPSYPAGTPNDSWTVPQLREYAKDEGILLLDATKKADILELITTQTTTA